MKIKVFFSILLMFFLPCILFAIEAPEPNEGEVNQLFINNMCQELMHGKEINEISRTIEKYNKELFGVRESLGEEDIDQKLIIDELSFVSREVATVAKTRPKGQICC
jgi:hypothetical protein